MDLQGGSEERTLTRRLKHLRSTGVQTWPSSESSTGMYNILKMADHSFLISLSVTELNISFHFRYFMRELVQHDAVVKPELPIFLTSWVDKSSAHCMYTFTQAKVWSISHLKAGCWYIECLKTTCPVEEEVVKAACDRADSKDATPSTNKGDEQEDEVEVGIEKE